MSRLLTPEELKLWRNYMARVPLMTVVRPVRHFGGHVLDLHGYTVHDAYHETRNFIEGAYWRRAKRLTIITGKSGQIRDEMVQWLDAMPKVTSYEFVNRGAVVVRIRLSRVAS